MKSADGAKILVCSDPFYPPKGGGVLSLREICAGLAMKGFTIAACYVGTQNDPLWTSHPQDYALFMRGMWPRIWELKRRWRRAVVNLIRTESPDVAITHLGVVVPTIEACKEMGVPVIVLVQGVDHFCLGSFWSGKPWKCEYNCVGCKDADGRLWQFPFFRSMVGRTIEAFHRADALVSNSDFIRRTMKALWGIDSSVILPISEEIWREQKVAHGDSILFFTPLAHKGVSVAIELAASLKSERFIFAGDIRLPTRSRIRGVANIEYLPWTSDINALYRRTKLLIMPSLIPEGFGMGCIEAMRRGIPCVVSDIGALPETVGRGGDVVRNYKDSNQWVKVLTKYRDPEYYSRKSADALAESMRYRDSKSVDKMAALIESVVDR